MRICVYGAGAIGGLIAAWLARSGQGVSVVARGAQLQAIQRHGLRVRSKGEVESFQIKAEADPAKLGTQDYVLVTVKAQSLTHVAESISPLLDKDTSVVTAMNGVPWWFFDRLKFGNGRERLESLDPGGKLSRAIPIGRAVGVDADIDPEARIDMARHLGKFKTSMLQDMEAGKPLEIDGLLAGTLEIAKKADVSAPFTESLFGLIRARAAASGQYR